MSSEELDPLALSSILARDTQLLSDEEIDILILGFRAERAAMLAAETAGKKKGKSVMTEADQKAKADAFELDLDNLV